MSLVLPILVLGLVSSLSPSTIVVFLLLLSTTRARVNALAFLVGWAASLTIVFTASYLVGASRPIHRGGGRTSVEVAQILVGLAFIGVGMRQWGRRHIPRQGTGRSNRFITRLSGLTPWGAAGVGVLKQPWAITAAAALVVLDHHTRFVTVAIAFLLFTAVSTASVALIYVYYARRPGEAQARLEELRAHLTRAGPTIFAAIAIVGGVVVALDGVIGLRST